MTESYLKKKQEEEQLKKSEKQEEEYDKKHSMMGLDEKQASSKMNDFRRKLLEDS